MLGYLDALTDALSARNTAEAERLMAHPLARLLPEDVRDEAAALTAGERDPLAAPLRTMQLRHQTAELLRDAPHVADLPEAAAAAEAEAATARPAAMPPAKTRRRRAGRLQQMELPLSA